MDLLFAFTAFGKTVLTVVLVMTVWKVIKELYQTYLNFTDPGVQFKKEKKRGIRNSKLRPPAGINSVGVRRRNTRPNPIRNA